MTAFSPSRGRIVSVRPPVTPTTDKPDSFFVDESTPGARDGTVVTADWFNAVSAVLRRAISDADIILNDGDPTMLSQAITALATVVAATGFLPLGGGTLTGPLILAADGVAPLSPVTVQQLQAFAAGLKPKGTARVATATALPASSLSGNVLTASANGALVVDGITVALNDIVLVKDQATAANNGLYQVTATGAVGAKWQL